MGRYAVEYTHFKDTFLVSLKTLRFHTDLLPNLFYCSFLLIQLVLKFCHKNGDVKQHPCLLVTKLLRYRKMYYFVYKIKLSMCLTKYHAMKMHPVLN